MKDIFAGLYNKIVGFFSSTEHVEDESKNVARNRLKLVLMQDRTNLNPYLLERMRGEMIELLSKYVEMDKEALDLNFENEGESIALMLSIPVIRAKEEHEIEAALKAEDEAKKELEEKLKALEEKEKAEAEEEVSEDENEETEEEAENESSNDEEISDEKDVKADLEEGSEVESEEMEASVEEDSEVEEEDLQGEQEQEKVAVKTSKKSKKK